MESFLCIFGTARMGEVSRLSEDFPRLKNDVKFGDGQDIGFYLV